MTTDHPVAARADQAVSKHTPEVVFTPSSSLPGARAWARRRSDLLAAIPLNPSRSAVVGKRSSIDISTPRGHKRGWLALNQPFEAPGGLGR